MGSVTTLKMEPHTRGWKTYNKKERAGKCLSKRERRGMGKNQYLWTIDQIIKMALFIYSSRIITILSISKSKFSPK